MPEDIIVNYFRYRDTKEIARVSEETLTSDYMAFVLEGELSYHINGLHFTVREGEAIYIPRGAQRRRDKAPCPAKYYSIHFSGGDDFDRQRISTLFPYVHTPEIMWCVSMIDSTYSARYCDEEASARRISRLFSLLLDFCAEASSTAPRSKYVDGIIEYIRKNYKTKLKISDIAHHVHLNPAYCSTLFKEETGMTIGEFITKYRLDIARHEITAGGTVREAAEAAGFSDPYNFSKWFHKNTGMPPSEYRVRSGAGLNRRR